VSEAARLLPRHSEDGVLGGRLRLRQPTSGYRVAIDPVFLAAAVPAGPRDTVLDIGCGVGAAALCLAARVPVAEPPPSSRPLPAPARIAVALATAAAVFAAGVAVAEGWILR